MNRAAARTAFLCAAASVFAACASGPAGGSALKAGREKAAAAISGMDGGRSLSADLPRTAPAGMPAPGMKKSGSGRPNWIDNPQNVYERAYYVSAVGDGGTRRQAEQNALGNLIAVFGQAVESSAGAVETYTKKAVSGKQDAHENDVYARQTVRVSSSMDSLFGAEIVDRWEDGKTHYAVAVMDRAECRRIYEGLFDANENLINRAVERSKSEGNSLEAVSNLFYAAKLAEINEVFEIILNVLGASSRKLKENSKGYLFDAKKAAAAVPFSVNVAGDKDGKIKTAFSSALSASGLKTVKNGSRYTLDVKFTIEPVTLKDDYKWAKYEFDSKITDNKTGVLLFPFTRSGREGHISQAQADERALSSVVEDIAGEYKDALDGYILSIAE